jgi:hypothetical protein
LPERRAEERRDPADDLREHRAVEAGRVVQQVGGETLFAAECVDTGFFRDKGMTGFSLWKRQGIPDTENTGSPVWERLAEMRV